MIELTDVNAYYNHYHAIKGITKVFADGSIYGIIGINGAGKTTLFNLMAGIKSYSGSIKTGNEFDYSARKEVVMLPTIPYFFPRSTGEEYLTFIKFAKEVPNTSTINNLFSLPLNKYVSSYSTGMKKKLAFTGLLIGEHEVYILDEPFNDVDLIGNVIMKNEIVKLRDRGKTILIASHILSSLTDICDEINLLQGGVLKRTFSKDEYNVIENHLLNAT